MCRRTSVPGATLRGSGRGSEYETGAKGKSSAPAKTTDSNRFMNFLLLTRCAWADPVSWGDPGSAGTFPLAPRTRRRRKQTRADGEELHPRVVYCGGAARKYDVLLMC